MKIYFLFFFVIFISLHANAKTVIGIVNVQKVYEETKEGKRNQIKIQSFILKKSAVVKEMQDRANQMQAKVDKQTIQESIGDFTQRDLANLEQEIETKSFEIQNSISNLERKITAEFKSKMSAAIKEVSLKHGIDMTVDSSKEDFLFVENPQDLTQEVIKTFDAKYP